MTSWPPCGTRRCTRPHCAGSGGRCDGAGRSVCMKVDVAWAIAWVRGSARVVFEHREELIELDRQIGDGDHGENLTRGFTAVLTRLDALETTPGDIGEVLRLVATTLMSTVGGAAGPLYGTAYLRAAKVTGFPELDSAGVVAMLEAGLEGIVLSLIHISEPTRLRRISYAVFCLK